MMHHAFKATLRPNTLIQAGCHLPSAGVAEVMWNVSVGFKLPMLQPSEWQVSSLRSSFKYVDCVTRSMRMSWMLYSLARVAPALVAC